jgi:hypothetical protein
VSFVSSWLTGVPNKSAELRVLFAPAATFRELTAKPAAGFWVLLRRPLRLVFVFGCVVSLWASGRLSARLIADGFLSFAFVPVFELAALAAVYWRGPRRVSFAHAADVFFVANAPWLLWLTAFAALRCLLSPMQATATPLPLAWAIELSLVATAAWSAYIDWHFFREVLPRPAGSARDLILQRTIGWTCTIGYFFGIAIWPEIFGRIG